MKSLRSIDVATLPPAGFGIRAPLWWGTIGLIAIEATTFLIFIVTYFYARAVLDVWPPPGTHIPHLLLATINMAILLASCAPAYWATEAARRNDRRGMQVHMTANVAMGLAALIIRIHNLYHVGVTWDANIYGSIVWIMLCFHTFDYVAALAESVVFNVISFGSCLGVKQRVGLEADSLTWYFIVAIWIPLYVIIYVLPNVH